MYLLVFTCIYCGNYRCYLGPNLPIVNILLLLLSCKNLKGECARGKLNGPVSEGGGEELNLRRVLYVKKSLFCTFFLKAHRGAKKRHESFCEERLMVRCLSVPRVLS